MSFRQNSGHTRSISAGGKQPSRFYAHDSEAELPTRVDSISSVVLEIAKAVRKLLPKETPLQVHVPSVEYIENGCGRSSGTLYMTTFRLVFAPDDQIEDNHFICSGNKYIGDYDIPFTSIYRVNIAPLDARSGFKSFLNENQIQSESRTFTIITRDFRHITLSKCSVMKSNSLGNKSHTSASKMEAYINALKDHCRFQNREQLYFYNLIKKHPNGSLPPRSPRAPARSPMTPSSVGRSRDDDIADFYASNDERIKSYMTYQDWNDELYDASEEQWTIDQAKFDKSYVARDEGPYVHLKNGSSKDNSDELIWHWTHTSEVEIDRRPQPNRKQAQYVLTTAPGIGEVTTAGDSLRRNAADSDLNYSSYFTHDQAFQRYNLARFPCNLKRLQASYEKLMEICVISADDDDDKWFTKLNACKWLKYVSKALHGAVSLAKLLNFKHIQLAGSDTDNSCLMSSLVQIFLRPKCRTIKGFCELIVREWVIRGHPFRERFGQVATDPNGALAQEAPVFLLFLDCVHQLIDQNPFAFEFTEYFLLELYRDVCNGYQHTFAFTSVLERLHASKHRPANTIVLSAFDFSLYLRADAQRLLKNYAFLAIPPRSRFPTAPTTSNSSAGQSPVRVAYRLETPKPAVYTREDSIPISAEQAEYDVIESPQKFINNLQVDWRLCSITLWSRCFCRYDQHYLPTLPERQLAFEINCAQDDIRQVREKSRRHIILDTFHPIYHANSWHSQILETNV